MQVSEEDAKKALNEQYGGEDATTPGTGLNHFKFTKYSNAYMLVYVRKSDWDQVSALQSLSCSAFFLCYMPAWSQDCALHMQRQQGTQLSLISDTAVILARCSTEVIWCPCRSCAP